MAGVSARVNTRVPGRSDAAFLRGVSSFKNQDYQEALEHFRNAAEEEREPEEQNACVSYLGLTRLMLGDPRGINLCRRAAHFTDRDADLYHNLALGELQLHDRRRAVDAIRAGLILDRSHKGLLKLQRRMGQRREPVLGFLSRDHFLNRFLGRITYKRARAATPDTSGTRR